jgi:Rieske Fe-S protein
VVARYDDGSIYLSAAEVAPLDGEVDVIAVSAPGFDGRLALRKTGRTFLATSLRCTHQGCIVQALLDGYACPCHGAAFGLDGQVLAGPAERPLRQFEVRRLRDGLAIALH